MSLQLKDQGRQWPKNLSEIPDHHRVRYKFAANLCAGRTLDAACGVGYGTSIIGSKASKVSEVVGVDKSEQAIGWAEKYFPGPKFVCGDVSGDYGLFETVVSLETIEHLQDPSPALKAFRRACKGKFIASVPNEEKYPFKAENFVDDESPHYRHYTPDEFGDLLQSHGFRVLEAFCQEDKFHPYMNLGIDGMFLIYVCC